MDRPAMYIDFEKAYFNIDRERCRQIGRRGGLVSARNRRARRQAAATASVEEAEIHRETAHEASQLLDALYPHLKDAFRPRAAVR